MTDKKTNPLADSTEVRNAVVANRFAPSELNLLREFATSISADNFDIKHNDSELVEKMLYSQAVALDSIFSGLGNRAAVNLESGHVNAGEKYLRLALKAQAQSRQALIALAETKNPKSIVVTKQANVANQQIVANASVLDEEIKKNKNQKKQPPNELKDGANNEQIGERLDIGAPTETITGDKEVETLEKVYRR
jgi:hypothetical protein